MKKLTILLFSILISFNSYGGWFGSDIKGAFGVKLGEVKNGESSFFTPDAPMNMFVTGLNGSETYKYYLTHSSKKVKEIRFSGYGESVKCASGNVQNLKALLEDKYGEFKDLTPVHVIDSKRRNYRFTDNNRSISINCLQSDRYKNMVQVIYKDKDLIKLHKKEKEKESIQGFKKQGLSI
jgi:hypothetical protein